VLRLELPKERELIFLGVTKKVESIPSDILIDRLGVIVHLGAARWAGWWEWWRV
jgi:hypothetical protein